MVTNATGSEYGANASYNGRVMVSGNATTISTLSGVGAQAFQYGSVTVGGDAIGDNGAYTGLGGSITISGNAIGFYRGVYANGEGPGSTIEVGGNVTATGETGIGAQAYNAGKITINGEINAPIYIRVGSIDKAATEYTEPTTKAGYRTFTDGTSSTVWVKIP